MPEEIKQNLIQDVPLVDMSAEQSYTPDPVPKNSVYKFMKANNLTNLSESDFLKKYSTPDKAKEIHSFMVANNLTTLKDNDFYGKYFPTQSSPALDGGDVKKKVQATDFGKVNYTDSKNGSEILSNNTKNNLINWIKGDVVKKENKELKPEQPVVVDNKSLSRLGNLMKGFKERGIKRKFGYDANYAGEIDEKTGIPVAELKKLQRQSSSTGPVTTDYRGNIVQDLVEYNAPGGLDYVATLPSGEKVKMTSTTPIPREVIKQVHKREVGEAAINTLDKLYKEKGQKFDKNSLEGQQQIEDYINKENSGDLVSVYGNFDQKPYLVRGRGFWESGSKQLVQSAIDPVLYTDINTTFNPSDLADKLDARIQDEGNIPESAPNSWGRYGELAGGLPKMATLLSIPFAGEAALVTDVYQNGMARQKMILYQKGLNEGLDRIEAARRAMSAAPTVAAPEAIVNLAMAKGVGNFGRDVSKIGKSSGGVASDLTQAVGKSIIPAAAKNTFKTALKNSAKSTAAISAMGAGSGAAEGLLERQAGYKVSNQDIINKTLEGGEDYLFMDLAFKVLHGAANAPAYLKSASKNLLNEVPIEILEAHAETIPDGNEILQKVQDFSKAKIQVKGLVADEKIASVAGLTEKINNIKQTIGDLNKKKNDATEALRPFVDKFIQEQQQQLNYYNEQVKKVVESKDPTGISEELDELTGEKAGKSNLDLPKTTLPFQQDNKAPEIKEQSVDKLIKIFVPNIDNPNFEITNFDKDLVSRIKKNPIGFIDNLLDINKRELEADPQGTNVYFINELTRQLEEAKQEYLNAEKAESKQEVPIQESVKPTEVIPEVTVEGLTEGYKVLGGKKENAIGDIRQDANEARAAGKDSFTKETIKDGKKTFTLVDTTPVDSVGRPAYKSASITLPEGTKLTIEDVMPSLESGLKGEKIGPIKIGEKVEAKPIEVGKIENTEKQEAINKANKQRQSTIEKTSREWQEANIDKEEHPLIVGDKLAQGVIIKVGEVLDYRENKDGKLLGKNVPEGGIPIVTSIEDLGNLHKQGMVDVGIFNSKEEANKWLADRDARFKQSYENKLSKIDGKYGEQAISEGGKKEVKPTDVTETIQEQKPSKKENINIKNIADEKGNINTYSLKAAIVDAPALINVNEKTVENTVGHLRQIADKINDKELNDTVTYLEDASNMLLSIKNMEKSKIDEFLSNQENFYSDKKPPSEVLERLDNWAKVLKGSIAEGKAERLLKEQYQQVLGEIEKRFVNEKQQPNRPKLLEATEVKPTEVGKQTEIVESGDDLILSHGTRHDFDKFQLEKIGTGEGAQAFGYGLYFTDGSKIAEGYAKKLSEDNTGLVYSVKIKNGKLANWAEWRRPLDESIESSFYDKLTKEEKAQYQDYVDDQFNSGKDKNYTGSFGDLELSKEGFLEYPTFEKPSASGNLYQDLKAAFGQEKATEIFKRAGIDGIKYESQGGYGNENNYVVFNPESIEVIKKSKGGAEIKPTEVKTEVKPTDVKVTQDDLKKAEVKFTEAKAKYERARGKESKSVVDKLKDEAINAKSELDDIRNRVKVQEKVQPEVKPIEKEVFKSSQGHTVDIENGKLIVRDKKGEVLSDRASKKAIEEYAENFDYSKGEKAPEVPSEITNSRDAAKYVIEESSNPVEIAEIYASEDLLPKEGNAKFQAIAEYGLGRIKTSSYKNLGDPNKIEKSMYLKIFSEEKGLPIDVLAKSISDKYGINIEPQDVVDYIEKYSKGDKAVLEFKESDVALQAADKFNKLTGLDLNSELANKVIDNKLGKANKDQLDIIKQDYETAKQLEDAYWAEYKKTDGFTKESNISEANKPETARESQKKLEEAYKDLTNIEKRQIINSKFEKLLEELKIEKICPTD